MSNRAGLLALALGCACMATPHHDTSDSVPSERDAAVVDPGGKKSPAGGDCRSNEDCQPLAPYCREPYVGGPPRGGGDLPPACRHQCESDQRCSPGYVCVPNNGCVMGRDPDSGAPIAENQECEPSCARVPCLVGQTCRPDGHCGPTACLQANDCPPNFACSAGQCARRACSGDGQCQGACVNGRCYPAPGICAPPAP